MQPPRRIKTLKTATPSRDFAEENLAKEVREIPMGIRRAAAWGWRIIVVMVLLYFVTRAIAPVSTLVVAVLVALLLASLLQPLVKALSTHTFLGRGFSAAIALIGLIIAVVGMFVLAGRQLAESWEEIYTKALAGFTQLWEQVTGYFNLELANWGQLQAQALDQLKNNASSIISGASNAAGVVGNIGTGALTALFTLFFLLAGGPTIWRWFLGLVPAHARTTTHESFRRGWKALSAYCRTQVLVAAVDATGIALGMVGIDLVNSILDRDVTALSPFAVPIWLIVFLFSFVPLVGAIVSGAIATLIVFVLQGWIPALVMLGIVLLVQQLESNVLQPILMGKAVELHPLAVFLGVAGGAIVAGIPGALFAIPFLAFLNAIYCYLDGRDPSPELGFDEKNALYFNEREKAREEFFRKQREFESAHKRRVARG